MIGSRSLVAARDPLPRAFLELHVEQGPTLSDANVPLGVVTGIVGYARGELVARRARRSRRARLRWRVATTLLSRPPLRSSACEMPRSAWRAPSRRSGSWRSNPAAPTSSRHACGMSLDVRAPDTERLDALIAEIGSRASYRVEPAQFAGTAPQALGDAIEARGGPLVELASGAGHDAGILASAGVDAAMLFVRSLNGEHQSLAGRALLG